MHEFLEFELSVVVYVEAAESLPVIFEFLFKPLVNNSQQLLQFGLAYHDVFFVVVVNAGSRLAKVLWVAVVGGQGLLYGVGYRAMFWCDLSILPLFIHLVIAIDYGPAFVFVLRLRLCMIGLLLGEFGLLFVQNLLSIVLQILHFFSRIGDVWVFLPRSLPVFVFQIS